MNNKKRQYLMLGIIGGILTMVGDCLYRAMPDWEQIRRSRK